MKTIRSISTAALSIVLLLSGTFVGAMEDANQVKTSGWLNSVKSLPTKASNAVVGATEIAKPYVQSAHEFVQTNPKASLAAGGALVAGTAYGAYKYAQSKKVRSLKQVLHEIKKALKKDAAEIQASFKQKALLSNTIGIDLTRLIKELPKTHEDLKKALQAFIEAVQKIKTAIEKSKNRVKSNTEKEAIQAAYEKAADALKQARAALTADAEKQAAVAVVAPVVVAKQGLFAKAGQAVKNGWNSSVAATKSVASKVGTKVANVIPSKETLVPSKETVIKAAVLGGAAGVVGYQLYNDGTLNAAGNAIADAAKTGFEKSTQAAKTGYALTSQAVKTGIESVRTADYKAMAKSATDYTVKTAKSAAHTTADSAKKVATIAYENKTPIAAIGVARAVAPYIPNDSTVKATNAVKKAATVTADTAKKAGSVVASKMPSKSTAIKAGLTGVAAATGYAGYKLYQNGTFDAMKDAVVPAVNKILSKKPANDVVPVVVPVEAVTPVVNQLPIVETAIDITPTEQAMLLANS